MLTNKVRIMFSGVTLSLGILGWTSTTWPICAVFLAISYILYRTAE